MRTWSQVSRRAGRNDLPVLLAESVWIEGDLDDTDLPYAVLHSWSAAEWPEKTLSQGMWIDLLERAGADDLHYLTDEDGEETATVLDKGNLPNPITLWRGCTEDRRYGMSWTESERVARWFAGRFGAGCKVYRAEVDSDFLLAYVTGRREAEWIVHPDAWESVQLAEV